MSPELWTVDIETRPHEVYSWGLFNQNHAVNQVIEAGGVMMFAAKKHGEKKIEAHCEWDDRGAMVTRAHEIFDRADYIISYNGTSFDSKHLRAEWVRAGLAPPSPWREVDLLKTVRKLNLASRKLSYVTGHLGLDCKMDPGGFDTWRQIIRPENEAQRLAAQRRMAKYCKNDVKITEQLFERLLPWVDGLNIPLYDKSSGQTEQIPSCTRCGSGQIQSRGWAYTTTYRYRRFQCRSCGGWMRHRRSEPMANTELRNA